MAYYFPNRTNLLLYLAGIFALLIVGALFYASNTGGLTSTDNIWFRPAKYAASLMGISIGLSVYTSFLPLNRQKLIVSALVALCLLTLGFCYTHLIYHYIQKNEPILPVQKIIEVSFLTLDLVMAYLLWELTRVDRRKLTLPLLFGLRFGLLLFIITNVTMLITQKAAIMPIDPFAHRGYPFYNWQIEDLISRVIFSIGSHSIIYLPILGYFLGRINGTKYTTITTAVISVIGIGFLVLLAVTAVAIKIGRPVF